MEYIASDLKPHESVGLLNAALQRHWLIGNIAACGTLPRIDGRCVEEGGLAIASRWPLRTMAKKPEIGGQSVIRKAKTARNALLGQWNTDFGMRVLDVPRCPGRPIVAAEKSTFRQCSMPAGAPDSMNQTDAERMW